MLFVVVIFWFSIFPVFASVEFEILRVPEVSDVMVFRVIWALLREREPVFVVLIIIIVEGLELLPRVISPAFIISSTEAEP